MSYIYFETAEGVIGLMETKKQTVRFDNDLKVEAYHNEEDFKGAYCMNGIDIKCVMVIAEDLPLGIIANTAAVMGVTLGKQFPHIVGSDVFDKTGRRHLGIIEFPIQILKGNSLSIKRLREKLYQPEFLELTVVDFSDIAQSCKTYDEFIGNLAGVSEADLNYFGLAICGSKKQVNKLTGSMPLLR